MLVSTRNLRIQWGQCDPAGIVFYPRYFEMFDSATTGLFELAFGMNKPQLFAHFGFMGYPMVDMRTKFAIPTRFGDDVVLETVGAEFRRSSFDIRHRLTKDGALAVECLETRVWAVRDPQDAERIKAQPIPEIVVKTLSA